MVPNPAPRPAELPGRSLTDPRSIRALAHPVRLALLQQITLDGPLTATAAAALVGESPSSCSFHLRQLAKYGFVEPAGGGRGRERPWQACQFSLSITDDQGQPEFELATDELLARFLDHSLTRFRASLRARRAYPADWREALPIQQTVLFVTPAELTEWVKAHDAIWHRFDGRIVDRTFRPPGSLAVEILLLGYPLTAPPSSSASRPVDVRVSDFPKNTGSASDVAAGER